jgi:hypothetical protein
MKDKEFLDEMGTCLDTAIAARSLEDVARCAWVLLHRLRDAAKEAERLEGVLSRDLAQESEQYRAGLAMGRHEAQEKMIATLEKYQEDLRASPRSVRLLEGVRHVVELLRDIILFPKARAEATKRVPG